jgi:hypothetical protein
VLKRVPSRLADTIYGSNNYRIVPDGIDDDHDVHGYNHEKDDIDIQERRKLKECLADHFSSIFIILGLAAGIILLTLKVYNVFQVDPWYISLCLIVGFQAIYWKGKSKPRLLVYAIAPLFIGVPAVVTATWFFSSVYQLLYLVLIISAVYILCVHGMITLIILGMCSD